MRVLPQSLFGRLLLMLLLGLTVAQLLSAAILLYDRGQVLQRAVGLNVARRIAAIVRLLDELPPTERRRLVSTLDLPPTRIRLDIPWQEEESEHRRRAALVKALLRRQLPAGSSLRVSVFDVLPREELERRRGPDRRPPRWRPRRLGALGVKAFQVQVGLLDGAVVTFRHRVPEDVLDWPYRLLLILLVLLLSVAVLAALAVRWLTRPLRVLATAAMDLGRDINRPPLPEQGPQEVRRAARAFNTMQTRLVRYIKDRGRVLAAVSHDLKTPITRLRLRAELLEDEKLRHKFQADLDDMERMVQATLDFMRGTEHHEQVVPVDVNALLESLRDDAAETGAAITLKGMAQAPLRCRPLALKRCLTNLIDNAVQYGRRATIRVQDSAAELILTIGDEGPGIPDSELEKVFDPFFRLEASRNRNTGGTGLGLGIARNIARAHGGELILRNKMGGGLEAVMTLPR
jgi:signal transduction histidine kinase